MIHKFIDDLATCIQFGNVTNQYSINWKYSNICRENLNLYLNAMIKLKPKALLVGEAPGYKGCRLSGIPFTAEYNLSIDYKEGLLFGFRNGYSVRNPMNMQKENSATIVWKVLKELDRFPLMWNAFPFHPYQDGNTESNRRPNSNELIYGANILRRIIELYNVQTIIGVGRIAENILEKIGFKSIGIRHPSMGGKNEFVYKMIQLKDRKEI